MEVLWLATAGDKPATQVARELGMRVNQLHKWKQQLEVEEASGMPAKRGRPVDGELDRLRRENAKLKEENDLLKKRPSSSHGNPNAASIHHCQSGRVLSASTVRYIADIDNQIA